MTAGEMRRRYLRPSATQTFVVKSSLPIVIFVIGYINIRCYLYNVAYVTPYTTDNSMTPHTHPPPPTTTLDGYHNAKSSCLFGYHLWVVHCDGPLALDTKTGVLSVRSQRECREWRRNLNSET